MSAGDGVSLYTPCLAHVLAVRQPGGLPGMRVVVAYTQPAVTAHFARHVCCGVRVRTGLQSTRPSQQNLPVMFPTRVQPGGGGGGGCGAGGEGCGRGCGDGDGVGAGGRGSGAATGLERVPVFNN